MSSLHPKIWIYWGARQEDARACAVRLARMFEDLQAIHPLFARWYHGAFPPTQRNRSRAARLPTIDELTAIFEKGRNYKDIPRESIPELGFQIGGWNGRVGDEYLGLQISTGAWTTAWSFPNIVSIEQDWFSKGSFPLTNSEIFGAALQAMVNAWDADWGRVSDRNYKNSITHPSGEQPPPPFWSGWIVYLASRYADHLLPPLQASVEKVPGRGLMIYATRERFDLDNPTHVVAADAIQASFAPIQGMIQSGLSSLGREDLGGRN